MVINEIELNENELFKMQSTLHKLTLSAFGLANGRSSHHLPIITEKDFEAIDSLIWLLECLQNEVKEKIEIVIPELNNTNDGQ